MQKSLMIVLLLALTNLAAAPADEVRGPVSFADLTGVMVLDNLYIAGQPSSEALAAARAQGIDVVINLRTSGEMRFDEQATAEGYGLSYHQVPIAGADGFSAELLAQIHSLVTAAGDQKVLVHCASGNRAGGWLAHYLADQQDIEIDDAFAAGRQAGLRSQKIEANLRQQLGQQP
ncbi:MAG: sulfur transferase domain-containing protein [Pseudomonadota bacterium]